ncbi:GatB/YqeY domain-containing protein [Thermococci archaeon]|nr:MAG: GatB/YqeY domain-containing protein [Thermococci archaeon]
MVEEKLMERIQEDLKVALKERDKDKASVLRMLISSLRNAQIENRGELSVGQELQVVSSYAKKLRESIEQFEMGGREDLVEREKKELEIVMGYLPKQLSEDEITQEVQKVISELGAESQKDIGRVMQEMMKRFRGRVDGKVVNRIVSEMLRR